MGALHLMLALYSSYNIKTLIKKHTLVYTMLSCTIDIIEFRLPPTLYANIAGSIENVFLLCRHNILLGVSVFYGNKLKRKKLIEFFFLSSAWK